MKLIFLSYARGDDEDFVRRLYDDLTARDFRVWFDKVNMPTRGLPFPLELRQAIDGSDRFVLVIGPICATSDWCCAEWRHADRYGRPITLVVRLDGRHDDGRFLTGFDLIPEELALQELHANDFRVDKKYSDALDQLVKQLNEPVAAPGPLVGIPALPPHLLQRHRIIRELRTDLLTDFKNPVEIMGMHGMGGLGKSVLANLLVRDPAVRRAFSDGIFWIPIGPDPEIQPIQAELIQALGGGTLGLESISEARYHLAHLLAKRAVLLVLDDVWQREALEAFRSCGPACRIVLTTRDSGLMASVGGPSFALSPPSDSEAAKILADAACMIPSCLPVEATAVAEFCGNLPLALALCGGLARRGLAWSKIFLRLENRSLARIGERHVDPANPHHVNLATAIQVSLDALPDGERSRLLELSVFPFDGSAPISAAQAFWAYSCNLDADEIDDLIIALRERSLLLPSTTGRLRLHGLVHTHVASQAGDLRVLHRRFCDSALTILKARPEEFQGYLQKRLPVHLVAAEDPVRLMELLCDERFDYFHQWAEQGLAADGCFALEYLVSWLLDAEGDSVQVRTLATQLARCNNRLGRDEEAARWLEVALAGVGQESTGTILQAVALHEQGSMNLSQHRPVEAQRSYRQALSIAKRLEPRASAEIAANLIGLAMAIYLVHYRPRRIIRLLRLALYNAGKADDLSHQAEACRFLADIFKDEMDYDQAEEYLERGLQITTLGSLSHAMLSLSISSGWLSYQRAARGLGDISAAEAGFRDTLERADKIDDWRYKADAWSGLGICSLQARNRGSVREAIINLQDFGRNALPNHLQARLTLLEAALLHRECLYDRAADLYSHVLAHCRDCRNNVREVDALVGLGATRFHGGQVKEAEVHWRSARAIAQECPPIRQVLTDIAITAIRKDDQACPL